MLHFASSMISITFYNVCYRDTYKILIYSVAILAKGSKYHFRMMHLDLNSGCIKGCIKEGLIFQIVQNFEYYYCIHNTFSELDMTAAIYINSKQYNYIII